MVALALAAEEKEYILWWNRWSRIVSLSAHIGNEDAGGPEFLPFVRGLDQIVAPGDSGSWVVLGAYLMMQGIDSHLLTTIAIPSVILPANRSQSMLEQILHTLALTDTLYNVFFLQFWNLRWLKDTLTLTDVETSMRTKIKYSGRTSKG